MKLWYTDLPSKTTAYFERKLCRCLRLSLVLSLFGARCRYELLYYGLAQVESLSQQVHQILSESPPERFYQEVFNVKCKFFVIVNELDILGSLCDLILHVRFIHLQFILDALKLSLNN